MLVPGPALSASFADWQLSTWWGGGVNNHSCRWLEAGSGAGRQVNRLADVLVIFSVLTQVKLLFGAQEKPKIPPGKCLSCVRVLIPRFLIVLESGVPEGYQSQFGHIHPNPGIHLLSHQSLLKTDR